MEEEEWRISSLNPKYEVSNYGNVRHVLFKKILKGYLTHDGYRRYTMYDINMKERGYYCHVLVATEFLERKNSRYTEVNHKNFNKLDNRVENLEWVTHDENMEHWRKSQKFFTTIEPEINIEADRWQKKVKVCQYSLSGELLNIYSSYTEAEYQTGIRTGNISLCTRGFRHTAGGFVWRDYVEGSTTIEKSSNEE